MRLSIANYAGLLTALVTMMGCGASTTDKNVDAGASMGASGVGGVPGIGGASGIGGTPGVGGASEPDCGSDVVEDGFVEVPASDPGIRYLGRLDFSDPNAPVMAFPAVTIETQFEGDAIDMRLAETAPGGAMRSEYYDVSIDQGAPTKLLTCPEREVYPLARDLAQGTHRVRISKRTEAQVGSASFLGFRVRENTTLQAPDAPLRRLEFVGDSITCGYGDEVSTTDPDSFPFTSTNENALLAYGPVTAAALDADVAVVAASGRGVVRNYGGGAGATVPEFYDRTAPDTASAAWDFSRYTPDVVVINLGTNDFSIGLTTDELPAMRESLRQTYTDFLAHLRELYPSAALIAAVGPMMSDSYPTGYQAWTSIRADVQEAIAARTTAGDSNVHYLEFATQTSPYGEDWHPTAATHQGMADELTALIRQLQGW